MKDALDTALALNGVLGKRPLRELREYNATFGDHVERPSSFIDGVAVVSRWTNPRHRLIFLFLECEPDAVYTLIPNADSRLQMDGA